MNCCFDGWFHDHLNHLVIIWWRVTFPLYDGVFAFFSDEYISSGRIYATKWSNIAPFGAPPVDTEASVGAGIVLSVCPMIVELGVRRYWYHFASCHIQKGVWMEGRNGVFPCKWPLKGEESVGFRSTPCQTQTQTSEVFPKWWYPLKSSKPLDHDDSWKETYDLGIPHGLSQTPSHAYSLHQTKGRESQELQRDALQAFARPNSGATTSRVDCRRDLWWLNLEPGLGPILFQFGTKGCLNPWKVMKRP